MFRTLSRAAGFALSLVTTVSFVHGEIPLPDQCAPYCQEWAEDAECKAWFGSNWYYCGWADGWTYCCSQ
jgi:hypothetical protein